MVLPVDRYLSSLTKWLQLNAYKLILPRCVKSSPVPTERERANSWYHTAELQAILTLLWAILDILER